MRDINKQFIEYNKGQRTEPVQYIVIHDTGNPGGSAQNHHDYFAGGDRQASADIFVDSNETIQIIDTDNFYSYEIGDGHGVYGLTNRNSVGIEMCLEADGFPSVSTIAETIQTTLYLMKKYNVPIERVVRHYDASRKSCPNSFMANDWAKWKEFKQSLASGGKIGVWKKAIDGIRWWYSYSDGSYITGWGQINNLWYYFDKDGYMLTGWQKINEKWYYLFADGSMATGWQKLNSKWYFFTNDGDMQIGWLKNNDWFFLGSNGAMYTGWKQIDSNWYYFYSTGQMASNTNIAGYKLNEKGQWIK